MRKELRYAIDEIGVELEQKRKQDLLAEIVLEEERGRELSKIVRESLPNPKSSTVVEKPSRVQKSNDRNRMSERLNEVAEKYFKDFISNVEDTDISSFHGERSDASSTLGVIKSRDSVLHFEQAETFQSPAGSNNCPVEMDDVILPWLLWETGNDGSPLHSNNKRELPITPKSILWDAAQLQLITMKEAVSTQDPSDHSTSSRGSSSPGLEGHSVNSGKSTVNILKDLSKLPNIGI
ncbi:Structural maintenance of chromosomes protein like [Actinidia chinensis var. chinensis]|uniref:Structural maintenance of chromosomes protein like n=1 Tax=Actinidia chinensis var. chinensis TaxID=1590841 RepID=A0A2R6QGH2_ACTCC|nr:Structural maintenance of chromosomes protein like [Actinidia chinensis var. chinensis]